MAVHDPPLNAGWLGKCNAMQFGAASAAGEYLLFSDADIIHAPNCFSTVIGLMEKGGYDFISLFPHLDNISFWENVNMPIYLFGIAKVMAEPGSEDPGNPNALASGALMLVKKRVFQEIGGFAHVKGEMLDDVSLARLLKRHGFRVGYRLAPACSRVRLFKNNHEAFWGTTKNILVAVEGHLWLAAPLLIIGILLNAGPLLAMTLGAFRSHALLLTAGILTYITLYLGFFATIRLISFRPIKALFFPLSAIVGACCIIRALVYHSRGAVFWRGREIMVKG
jgi:GT2 family glycosyltransferase